MVDLDAAEIFRQLPPAERALAQTSAQSRNQPNGGAVISFTLPLT